jgi:hypothetical protein
LRQQFNSKRYNIVLKNLFTFPSGYGARRSEGGTRSPLRVDKFRRRSRTYLASPGGAADPPLKIARLMSSALFVTLLSAKSNSARDVMNLPNEAKLSYRWWERASLLSTLN